MEQLFKNQFLEINSDKNLKYAEIIYFEATADMTEDDFKMITYKTVELFKQFFNSSIFKIFFDARKNFFPIEPELQIWTANQFDQFKEIPYKAATILSSEMITALSIEQVVDEFDMNNRKMENRFFDDIESAKNG